MLVLLLLCSCALLWCHLPPPLPPHTKDSSSHIIPGSVFPRTICFFANLIYGTFPACCVRVKSCSHSQETSANFLGDLDLFPSALNRNVSWRYVLISFSIYGNCWVGVCGGTQRHSGVNRNRISSSLSVTIKAAPGCVVTAYCVCDDATEVMLMPLDCSAIQKFITTQLHSVDRAYVFGIS